jgi:Holliday junction resolvase RusA-like endonuclease
MDAEVKVTLTIVGDPKPQGSKTAFNAKNGQARTKESGGIGFAAWRNAVAEAAVRARFDLGVTLDGPLRLDVAFRFRMPKTRPAAVRRASEALKTTAPDLSKLVRALEDGLQAGGLITDDARICHLVCTKTEVLDGWVGAQVTIAAISRFT